MITDQQLSAAITKSKGNLSAAARAVKITRQAVQQRVKSSPELMQLVEDGRESVLDEAESSLEKAIRRGEPWAVCFALKTIGKNRGYVEKQEQQHSGGIKVVIEYADPLAPSE